MSLRNMQLTLIILISLALSILILASGDAQDSKSLMLIDAPHRVVYYESGGNDEI